MCDWALNFNVNQQCFTELLKFVKKHVHNVPADSKTWLDIPKQITEVKTVAPVDYCHLAIKSGISHNLSKNCTAGDVAPHKVSLNG